MNLCLLLVAAQADGFTPRDLDHNTKGRAEKLHPFAGDIAAMIITRDAVTSAERRKIRDPLDGLYGFLPRK